MQESISSTD